jgi:hypothetical protein
VWLFAATSTNRNAPGALVDSARAAIPEDQDRFRWALIGPQSHNDLAANQNQGPVDLGG